jgi:hypothetical protein
MRLKIVIMALFIVLASCLMVSQVGAQDTDTVRIKVTDEIIGTITKGENTIPTYRIYVYKGTELLGTFEGTRDAYGNKAKRGNPSNPLPEAERYDKNHECPAGQYHGSKHSYIHKGETLPRINIGDSKGGHIMDNPYGDEREYIQFHPTKNTMWGCIGVIDYEAFYKTVNTDGALDKGDVTVEIIDRYDTDRDGLPDSKDLGGIDFSSIQLNYISLPSDQNEKTFSYVLKAKKAEEGDKIIDIEDAAELSLSAFFIGLTLPDSKFWVNLDPFEPDVITDDDLRNTDVGRIMLEADLQMKKDLCKYTNPCESEIGEEYWALVDKKSEELIEECMRKHPNEIEDADNVLFEIAWRLWIVPDKTDAYLTDGEVYIVDITLNVKSEQLYEDSIYQIVNQNLSLSDECKEDLSEASKE